MPATLAYTHPETFSWTCSSGEEVSYPYQRIFAIRHGRTHVGDVNVDELEVRELDITRAAARLVLDVFQTILEAKTRVNCHYFTRIMQHMEPSTVCPVLSAAGLAIANKLTRGSAGVLQVDGYLLPHSIGYGMDGNDLQVQSPAGELGIAHVDDVLQFYATAYNASSVNLLQLP